MSRSSLCGFCAPIFVFAALAGCTANADRVFPLPNVNLGVSIRTPAALPPKCQGQKTVSKYASITDKLATSPTAACIPAFGGFGGTLGFPGASPSITVSIIVSTTNYNHKMPPLEKSGSPLVYIQGALSGGTSFGKTLPSGGGLAGAEIVAGTTYTVTGKFSAGGRSAPLGPCYAVGTPSKYGGALPGITRLFPTITIPVAGSAFFEIYKGKLAAKGC